MSWHLVALIVAVGLFAFDFQNMLAWWRGRTLGPAVTATGDYTIVVPVYGHPRYFDGRAALAGYRERVLVAVNATTQTMREFADLLEQEGWRVARTLVAAPSPPKLMQAALPWVTTRLTVRMDADTIPVDALGPYLQAMLDDGADLCSFKVEVSGDSQAQKMQALEYRMAMLSRHFRPWLLSGAAYAARTAVLREVLALHTMHYLGEDVEAGRIGLALRARVRHLDCRVTTDAPETWAALFRQRRLWWAGCFRHSVMNLDRNVVHTPTWSFYYVALVWCGVYFKSYAIFEWLHPFVLVSSFALLFAVYAVVTVVANWQVRSWRMLVFPPYALVQSILMPTVGSIYYVMLARRTGSLGRYQFGYRRATEVTA